MEQTLQTVTGQNNLAIWAAHVRACRTSGLTVKNWCAENGIVPNTYYRWQKKVFDAMEQETGQFYEVPMSQGGKRSQVSIEVNGMTAHICSGADMETILAALQAMRSC